MKIHQTRSLTLQQEKAGEPLNLIVNLDISKKGHLTLLLYPQMICF